MPTGAESSVSPLSPVPPPSPPPPPGEPEPVTTPTRKRLGVFLILSLVFSLVSWLCLSGSRWAAKPFAVILTEVPWALLAIGAALVPVAGILALISFARALRFRRRGHAALSILGPLAAMGFALAALVKAIWAIIKALFITTVLLAAMSPCGAMVLCAFLSLPQAIRNEMTHRVNPEWRMIRVEYLGSDLPDARGKVSFSFVNTGPLSVAHMEGKLHVWDADHIEMPVTIKPRKPIGPGESVRVDHPLDDFGRRARRIIEEAGKAGPLTTQPVTLNRPEADGYYLRFQLKSMTTGEGKRHVIWPGNLEIADKNWFFESMRDFANPEWRMIRVDYLPPDATGDAAGMSFRLTNGGEWTLADFKGKLQVMDISEGHMEKTVTLSPGEPLAPGQSMRFDLPAGAESALARRIISRGSEIDRLIGNQDQTTYLLRFQLQEFHTRDGRKIFVWFGKLKGDLEPHE